MTTKKQTALLFKTPPTNEELNKKLRNVWLIKYFVGCY